MAAYLKAKMLTGYPQYPHYYPAEYGIPDLDFSPFTFNEHRIVNTAVFHFQLCKSLKKYILKFTSKFWPKQKENKAGKNENDTAVLPIKTTPITDDYRLTNNVLGIGMNGKVVVCFNKATNEKFALKILQDSNNARREVELQWLARKCENVVNVVDVYDNTYRGNKCLLMVMECMEGGELFQLIKKKPEGVLTERKVAEIVRSICKAIESLHGMNIAHRDLKPENLLYKHLGNTNILKLTDFGFAKRDTSSNPLQTPCYTPYFVAPEILVSGQYNKSCDMWSLGVIIYLLLSGHPPFFSSNRVLAISSGMKNRIRNGQYDFATPEWKNISEDAKDLIRGLLKTNPSERFTIENVLTYKWISNCAEVPETPLYMDEISRDDATWLNMEMTRSLEAMRDDTVKEIRVKDLESSSNPLLLKRQQRTGQI